MAEASFTTNRWIYGAVYFAVMIFLILMQILPLDLGPYNLPGPDLLLCVTFAWILRRPHFMPTPLVALVFLAADMILMRPLGLWSALVVIAVEFLRVRESSTREQLFPVEWAMVSGVILAIVLGNHLILTIFAVQKTGLGLSLLQFIATIVAYPVIVLLSRFVLGVDKMSPNDTDARGRPR